jgi:hypothetical protein
MCVVHTSFLTVLSAVRDFLYQDFYMYMLRRLVTDQQQVKTAETLQATGADDCTVTVRYIFVYSVGLER